MTNDKADLIISVTTIGALVLDTTMRALGIQSEWPELIVGAAFAITGGFIAMTISRVDDRPDKVVILLAALFIGLLAAIGQPHFPVVNDLPIQLVMGVAGMGSRKAVMLARDLDFKVPRKGK